MWLKASFLALACAGALQADPLIVPVSTFGGLTLGQDLQLAVGETGPWETQRVTVPVQPGHCYTLTVRAKLDQGSKSVTLQPYFVASDGSITLIEPLQARAHFEVEQRLHGIVAPPFAWKLGYYLKGEDPSIAWWRSLKLQDEGFMVPGPYEPAKTKDLAFAFDRLRVGPRGAEDLIDINVPVVDAVLGQRLASEVLNFDSVYQLGNGAGLLKVSADEAAVHLEWQGCGAGENAAAMGLFLKAKPTDTWILPYNGGLRVPVSQAQALGNLSDAAARSGHYLSLPFIALQRGDGFLLLINETPADASFRFWIDEASAGYRWLPTLGSWGAPRRIRLSWVASGGVAAVAQEYRRWAETQEPVRTLSQKVNRVPAVADLAGAVNIHYFKRAIYWSNDPAPGPVALAMKQAGLERVLWSQKASVDGVDDLKHYGFLPGRYEDFQDVYQPETALYGMNTEGWPEQIVLTEAGTSLRGWAYKEGKRTIFAGVRNALAGLESVQSWLAKPAQAYKAVFLDTTTASAPIEDWSLSHPLTRSQDLAAKDRQLAEASDVRRLVTGSESGHDGALNEVHYFEGMKSPWVGRFDDAGYDLVSHEPATAGMLTFNVSAKYRLPLFELAYHDCIVDYEYWGDSANRNPEFWRFRDLLSCLYGQPELWVLDAELWHDQKDQCVKSYQTWSPVVRHLFGQKMLDWQVLDASGQVQETHWEDGSVVRVDFAKDRLTLKGPVAEAGAR